MSFNDRITKAIKHEKAVLEWLHERKIKAFPFGQGLLDQECRDELRRFNTNVRWMPDIVVFSRTEPSRHGYIDAKTGRLDTSNHAIEIAALEAAKAWTQFSGAKDYFFIWENGETATLDQVINNTEFIPGCLDGVYGGSGTPFVLFARQHCSPFEAIFGEGRGPDYDAALDYIDRYRR